MFTVNDYNFLMTEWRYSGGGFTHDKTEYYYNLYLDKDMRISTIINLILEKLDKPIPRTKDDKVLYCRVFKRFEGRIVVEAQEANDPEGLKEILNKIKQEGISAGTAL